MNAAVADRPQAGVQTSPLWLEELTRRWSEVIQDQSLADLPYKIETNRSGQLIMSPAKTMHARFQGELAALLKARLGGCVFVECPDVAWAPASFADEHRDEVAFKTAPEICVEVKSPSNALPELLAKVRLYLDAGAREVWLRNEEGRVEFHDASGQIEKSNYGIDVLPLK
ncbi:MAG TPA: Uma2 family endonuclease [Burkholderiaceae bacterium]|nr:Uma2 family endonuclease [Burkholderiaceae bacterium]